MYPASFMIVLPVSFGVHVGIDPPLVCLAGMARFCADSQHDGLAIGCLVMYAFNLQSVGVKVHAVEVVWLRFFYVLSSSCRTISDSLVKNPLAETALKILTTQNTSIFMYKYINIHIYIYHSKIVFCILDGSRQTKHPSFARAAPVPLLSSPSARSQDLPDLPNLRSKARAPRCW